MRQGSPMGQIPDPNVLELHVALPSGMQLESNRSVKRGGFGVSEVHHWYTVQTGTITVSNHLDQIIVPLAHADDAFVLRSGPHYPGPAIFGVDASGMVHHRAVDFK